MQKIVFAVLCAAGLLLAHPAPAAEILNPIFAPYQTYAEDYTTWLRTTLNALKAESRVVNVPGFGPVEYQKKGQGPVVLSLHGGFGGYDQGMLIAEHLLYRGFTIIAVSRPGYLRTPLSVGQTLAAQADAMVGLMDVLKIKRAAVLGFSAGAPVAAQIAIRHPSRLWALVLECVGAHPDQAPEYQIMLEVLKDLPAANQNEGSWAVDQLAHDNPSAALPFFFNFDTVLDGPALVQRENWVLSQPGQLAFFKRLVDSLSPMGPRRAGTINDIEGVDPYGSLALEKIRATTLMVQAREDDSGDYPEALKIKARIPNVRMITVEDSGHFIWLGVHANAWEARLANFLRQQSPR